MRLSQAKNGRFLGFTPTLIKVETQFVWIIVFQSKGDQELEMNAMHNHSEIFIAVTT